MPDFGLVLLQMYETDKWGNWNAIALSCCKKEEIVTFNTKSSNIFVALQYIVQLRY